MERISDIDVYEFKWGQGGAESLMLTSWLGDWCHYAGKRGVWRKRFME